MGLVQEHGQFAEHRAGCIHAGDLHSILDDLSVPLLRKSSPPVFEPAVSTTSRARCFTTGKPASLLSRLAKSGISEGMGPLPFSVSNP
jgi:hypothetical protein